MTPERYAAAVRYAATAHAGQVRKGTSIPYITHPIAVSGLVMEFGGDEDQAIAGLLHDVVEDCGVSLESLEAQFGGRVAAIVDGCTDGVPDAQGHKPPWRERKEQYLAHLEQAHSDVLLVSACDKLHNARAIVADLRTHGLTIFERFTAGQDGTTWYYRQLAGVFGRRLGHQTLVRLLEHEVGSLANPGLAGAAAI